MNETTEENKRRIVKMANHTCSVCGCIFENPKVFEVHHIKPVSENQPALNNCVVVCANCHKRLHEENTNRLTGAGIGGAILGASLGGPIGAIVGGLAGLFLGDNANKSNKHGGN